MSRSLRLLGAAHGRVVHGRRLRVLARGIAPLLEPAWTLLDVGCGDGRLASLLAERVPGLVVRGLEVRPRPSTAIKVEPYDGTHLPVPDSAVDAVLFSDVLHHTVDPRALLADAARASRRAVIIKDHRMERAFAGATLRVMDWVGNRAHGVALPYNYWPERQWRSTWLELGLELEHFQTAIGLYPWPASFFFERGLHFIARLRPLPR